RTAPDADALPGDVSAAIIATPTETHAAVATACLEAGRHCLVEKPITRCVDEGERLVALAAARQRVLQVGHIERFNPIFRRMSAEIEAPAFVEAERLAPFVPRSLDVDVILDLMIHDLDLLLSRMPTDPVAIDGVGVAVLTPREDIANVRLRFGNGAVANLTASRVSQEKVRKIRFFGPRGYLSLDLLTRSARRVQIAPGGEEGFLVPGAGRFAVAQERFDAESGDALSDQLRSFLEAISRGTPPVVSGGDGLRALRVAVEIGRAVQASLAALRDGAGAPPGAPPGTP
ncbi:MAG: gfo/Idh/MocA family oxidoreductase, partial [Candidatus Eisenbacteria bacterium]|nr:gfo/Idh/MocA family oxidoreductase [Candidatus Eisenbacteria bacterium]